MGQFAMGEGRRLNEKGRKQLLITAAVYCLLAALFFWIVKDDWRQTRIMTDPVSKTQMLGELKDEDIVEQGFTTEADELDYLYLAGDAIHGAGEGKHHIDIALKDGGQVLWQHRYPLDEFLQAGCCIAIPKGATSARRGETLTLEIRGNGGIALWYGETRQAGKFEVKIESRNHLTLNGEPLPGELVLKQSGLRRLHYIEYYWPAAGALLALILLTELWCLHCRKKGKPNKLNKAADVIRQYTFLLKTLVVRDFQVRYKASVLGILWSFLNPLLMTFVYMFVFSTIFQSSIEHFVVYLMSGITLFNYFSEATNLGMQSIVGNAGLIKKVYIPKYVFPISKALSSAINLTISLIPLLVMMALTGVSFHKSLLLMPLVLLFLIVFTIGLSLILSTCIVYFRDTQFIWGILLTIWNFLSPIFYPESIIPAQFIRLYHMNPMYQFLYFMRTITIGGISPTPITYLYCTIASGLTLIFGLLVFRRNQGRFVLHL